MFNLIFIKPLKHLSYEEFKFLPTRNCVLLLQPISYLHTYICICKYEIVGCSSETCTFTIRFKTHVNLANFYGNFSHNFLYERETKRLNTALDVIFSMFVLIFK